MDEDDDDGEEDEDRDENDDGDDPPLLTWSCHRAATMKPAQIPNPPFFMLLEAVHILQNPHLQVLSIVSNCICPLQHIEPFLHKHDYVCEESYGGHK